MSQYHLSAFFFFFFQAEDGIRDLTVTGVQTCALPICFASLLRGTDRIRNIDSGRIALWPRSRPSNSRAGGPKHRRVGDDLPLHLQGNVAPLCPASVHVRASLEIANADCRAHAGVVEPFQMVDQILTGEESLGHRTFHDVLESVVAMQVDE